MKKKFTLGTISLYYSDNTTAIILHKQSTVSLAVTFTWNFRELLLNYITILVMGHPPTAVDSKSNTEKFDMIVVIFNQCSTINQTANDDGSALTTIVLIIGAMLTPAYWTAGE